MMGASAPAAGGQILPDRTRGQRHGGRLPSARGGAWRLRERRCRRLHAWACVVAAVVTGALFCSWSGGRCGLGCWWACWLNGPLPWLAESCRHDDGGHGDGGQDDEGPTGPVVVGDHAE